MSVRVRFAPSPTGYLHVGGLRTALYNYLFAKRHGGVFVVRIEDTDQTRYVEGSVEDIMTSLEWAGMTPDESSLHGGAFPPYTQSERTELYRQYAEELIANDTAYYAFDTAQELDAMRDRQKNAGIAPRYDRSTMRNQYTLGADETKRLLEAQTPASIRLKVPLTGEVKFSDLVRGTIIYPCKDIDDQILLKSDGFPTYHLANVVDDHTMEITHVIRGEEWLPSTPKHVLLYKAFGWNAPDFAHLPLLLNPDKTKLSKRQGSVATGDFIAAGYFQEAFLNFIALLGWNPSGTQEIYSIDELIQEFDIAHVNKSGAVFDLKKLAWINSQYMKMYVATNLDKLVTMIQPQLQERSINVSNEYLGKVIRLLHERITLLPEIIDFGMYMFVDTPTIQESFLQEQWNETSKSLLKNLRDVIAALPSETFDHSTVHTAIGEYIKERGIKFKECGNILRLALTGISVGGGMMDTIEILGQQKTLKRIDDFIASH